MPDPNERASTDYTPDLEPREPLGTFALKYVDKDASPGFSPCVEIMAGVTYSQAEADADFMNRVKWTEGRLYYVERLV